MVVRQGLIAAGLAGLGLALGLLRSTGQEGVSKAREPARPIRTETRPSNLTQRVSKTEALEAASLAQENEDLRRELAAEQTRLRDLEKHTPDPKKLVNGLLSMEHSSGGAPNSLSPHEYRQRNPTPFWTQRQNQLDELTFHHIAILKEFLDRFDQADSEARKALLSAYRCIGGHNRVDALDQKAYNAILQTRLPKITDDDLSSILIEGYQFQGNKEVHTIVVDKLVEIRAKTEEPSFDFLALHLFNQHDEPRARAFFLASLEKRQESFGSYWLEYERPSHKALVTSVLLQGRPTARAAVYGQLINASFSKERPEVIRLLERALIEDPDLDQTEDAILRSLSYIGDQGSLALLDRLIASGGGPALKEAKKELTRIHKWRAQEAAKKSKAPR